MSVFVTRRISSRRRALGSILKAARSKQGLTLEAVEATTKIHRKYLIALEDGHYNQLPAEAYNIGFIRLYAQFLKLKPDKIVQLYRQERSQRWFRRDDSPDSPLAPKRVGDWQFLITPKLLGLIGMLLLFGSVGLYIGFQVRQFARPPALVIANLPEEFTSSKDTVKLVGSASEGASVSINTEPILVENDGSFSQVVQLSPGLNEIIVLARNRVDKETRRQIKVLYNPDLAKADQSGTKE